MRFDEPTFSTNEKRRTILCRFSCCLSYVLDDAGCYGVGGLFFPFHIPFDVVIVIDEADFYEDCRHGGAVDDQEIHVLLDAPVGQFQCGAEVLLYGVAHHDAVRRIAYIRLRTCGTAIESIEMDGHKKVGLPAVGCADKTEEVIFLIDDMADFVLFILYP